MIRLSSVAGRLQRRFGQYLTTWTSRRFGFNTREASDGQRFERVIGRVLGRRLTYDDLTGQAPRL